MKISIRVVKFEKVDNRREEHNTNNKKKHQQNELIKRGFESVRKYLEAFEMPRQLEYAKDAHETNYSEYRKFHRHVCNFHEIRQHGQEIDYIAELFHKF